MTLADRMAVFLEGQIKQVGTPEEVFNRPNSIEVAAFIGSPPMNLMPARLDGRTLNIEGHHVELAGSPDHPAGPVTVGVRPSHLHVAPDGIPLKLYLSENLGESRLLNLELGDSLVKMRVPGSARFSEGDSVPVMFDADSIHLFDADSGLRIAGA